MKILAMTMNVVMIVNVHMVARMVGPWLSLGFFPAVASAMVLNL